MLSVSGVSIAWYGIHRRDVVGRAARTRSRTPNLCVLLANWKAATELGRAFQWEPKGAVFCPWRGGDTWRDRSYRPDGWLKGCHELEPGDARVWALALRACVAAVDEGRCSLPAVRQPPRLVGGMSANEYRQANQGLTLQFLVSFAEFMEKGPFRFGWDS